MNNLHNLFGKDIHDREEKDYRDYRNKWVNNPKNDTPGEFPLFLDIEATSACNLKCPHCVQSRKNYKKGFMSLEMFKKIIDEASANGCYGCKFHTIGRGEPLLNSDIAKMIIYAKKQGMIDVYLNTNGLLLSRSKIKDLFDSGLDRISISIDGYTKDMYEKNRKGASFEVLLSNVMSLFEYRNRMHYSTKIRIQTVNMPNISLKDFSNFWSPYADEVSYLDFKDMHRRIFGLKSFWKCPQLWQRMSILYDGSILPCNHDDRLLAVLGNIEKDNLYSIWNGTEMKYIRETHKRGLSNFIAACDGCSLRTSEILKEN